MTDANTFLMGGGAPSAKFPALGASITGTIAQPPEVRQQSDYETGALKFWDDGTPRMQLQVILQTSERDPANPLDDGQRAIYVKAQMQKAVRDAVIRAGAKGLEVGGTLQVTYAADGEAKGRLNPPKHFTAVYTPPTAAAANEFLNGGQAAAPAAPQPPVTPAQPADPWGQPQGAPPQFAQQAAPAQPVPAQPVAAPAGAPAGVTPEAMAALQNLTPEQIKVLGIGK